MAEVHASVLGTTPLTTLLKLASQLEFLKHEMRHLRNELMVRFQNLKKKKLFPFKAVKCAAHLYL